MPPDALFIVPATIGSIALLVIVARLCGYRIRLVWRESTYIALEPAERTQEPPKALPAPKPKTRTKKRPAKRR